MLRLILSAVGASNFPKKPEEVWLDIKLALKLSLHVNNVLLTNIAQLS